MSLLKSHSTVYPLGLAFLTYFIWCQMEPYLSLKLIDSFQMSEKEIGCFFSIMVSGSVCASYAVQFLPKTFNLRRTTAGFLVVNSFAFLLNGPTQILPDNLFLMAIGNLISGFSMTFIVIINLTDLTQNTKEIYPGQEEAVSDYCSGVYNSALALGQTLGPLFGAFGFKNMGFIQT